MSGRFSAGKSLTRVHPPLVNRGSPANPDLEVSAATTSAAGSLAAADKVLINQLATATAWAAPTLAANWGNFGGAWQVAGYRKDALGRIQLRGLITKSVAVVPGETIFTLPAGFRPALDEYFVVNSNGFGTVVITAAGAVNVPVGNAAYLSLAAISFDTV